MDLIDEYVSLSEHISDAPVEFHLTASYWIASTVIGQYVTTPTSFNPYGIKPNIWSIIVGPSRIVRKTTVLNMAEDTVRKVYNDDIFLPASFSPEALIEALSGLHTGDAKAWVIDEMGGFFKSLQKRYMAGSRELLSRLYSGRGERRKLRSQEFNVPHGLYITVFGNMPTPSSYYITDEDFTSGFMNRFLLSYKLDRSKHLPLARTDPKAHAWWNSIIDEYKKLVEAYKKLSLPVVALFDKDAQEIIDRYDLQVENEIRRLEKEEPYSLWKSYIAEAPMYLLKLSVIRHIASNLPTDPMIVSRPSVEKAFVDLQGFLSLARQIVDEVASSAKPKPVETERKRLEHLYGTIRASGPKGAKFGQLLARTGLLKDTIIPLLDTLHEQGKISFFYLEPGPHGGRPGVLVVSSEYAPALAEQYDGINMEKVRTILRVK